MTDGQGITMFSNAFKVLEELGFDTHRAASVPATGWRLYESRDVVKDIEMDFSAGHSGQPRMQMRSDFREELLCLTMAPSADLGLDGQPAKVVIEKAVVDVGPDEGTVSFADGSKESADLIIISDRVHSRLCSHILNNDSYQANKIDLTFYRVALSADKAREAFRSCLPHFWDPAYPLRGYEYINLSVVFPSRDLGNSNAESWRSDGDHDEMVSLVADKVKMWHLRDMDPLPRWNQGRAILIGDVAYPMTPLQGQGANMVIEAEVFCLTDPTTSRDEIPELLQKIDSVRLPHEAAVLNGTRTLGKDIFS
ncbi:uncharacterized protein ATNIH1004_002115 [Aspergillus tanneri]|uniref:FAD-binding domain-containing protein n=1 Tax=Aspergillus tanneri TaxID=1220188 RepID=A0A5M9MVN3_9EURO|nr:uncharacterized protein ATNIH1004_002115 [Aspergillus tanneri]KAA8649444.1 hypothetical protein ATNIH1004_002115 [Aspergillus tanneri]